MSVLATIEPTKIEVEPGGTATATIRVRNQSERVDGFRLESVGVAASWVTVEPPLLQLFPRTEGTAKITFAPPRASVPRAGTYPFAIRAQSVANPDASVVEEGDVTVRPFVALQSALDVRLARGWRSGAHRVSVQNVGNAPAGVKVQAVDPDGELRLSTLPAASQVEPGGTGRFRTTVSRPLVLRGSPKRWPYSIEVSEPAAGKESLAAVFEQRALLPGWLLALAGVALAAAVALIAFPGLIDQLTGGGATDTPAATQTPAPTPTDVPATATPEPTPTPPVPTATPEPTPVIPTPVPPFVSSMTFDGPPAITGTFSAISGKAIEGGLTLQFEYAIFGDVCHVQVTSAEFVAPGTYPVGGVEDGLAYGLVQCEDSGAFYQTTGGSVTIDGVADVISGSLDIFLTSSGTPLHVTGPFANVPVTAP